MTKSSDDETGSPGAPPRKRLLLFDDEPAITAPMARYFSNLGWYVDAAGEFEESLALITHRRYDLAILDLRARRLGNATGLELLREIRRHDHWTNVILLSAYVSPEVEEEARELGVDAVLRKPQALPDLAQFAMVLTGGR